MTPRVRLIALTITLLIVAFLMWWLLRPQALTVETATASMSDMQIGVEAEAKTRIHDRFVVSAPVPGRLTRIALNEGDRVTSGQRLAAIDPLPYTSSIASSVEKLRELEAQLAGVETLRPKGETLAQARARVAASTSAAASTQARVQAAQAAFEQASRNASRAAALAREGYAPQNALEEAQLAQTARQRELQALRAESAAAQAQVAVERAFVDELLQKVHDPDYLRNIYLAQMREIQSQLQVLRDQSSRTTINAPVSGEVLRVLQKSEAYVTAGTPLLEIGNRGTLEIVADVLSQDAVSIHVGDPVEILRGAGTNRPRGFVRLIEPAGYTKISALGIEEQRVNVIATIPNPPATLGDAYRLDVRITTWSGRVLAVPMPALVRCGESWCAYVVANGRARRVIVRVGRMNENDAEIIAGIRAGDAVIIRPPEALSEGTRVIPRIWNSER